MPSQKFIIMNKTKISIGLLSIILLTAMSLFSQDKKVQSFTVKETLNVSAEKVWAIVGEDFGAIANSHPSIVASNYLEGTTVSGEGAERQCNYNEQGTKYLHEKQVNYNPEEMTFDVKIFHIAGLPLNSDYSGATYKVVPVDEHTSKFVFTMTYRTKPAFMGALAKGKFKKSIGDYAIAVEHHALTGENVSKDNFKQIKKDRKNQSKS